MKITKKISSLIALLFALLVTFSAASADTKYIHVNYKGSPVAATDSRGDIIWRQKHSSFGFRKENDDQLSSGSSIEIGIAGHIEEWHNGRQLVYMNSRYYDPLLGRFLSPDPVRFHVTNPQSFNRYAYANNNPNTYVDPNGELPILVIAYFAASAAYTAYETHQAYKESGAIGAAKSIATGAALTAVGGLAAKGAGKVGGAIYKRFKKGPCGCFDADTLILAEEGYKPISEIEVGDRVMAKNEKTGEVEYKPVTELLRYEDREFYELELIAEDGQSSYYDVTDDHPFWVEQLGWVESDDLQPGMLVLDLEGDRHGVKGMTPSGVSGLSYNFEVEDFHTYFVGVENVWVHNCIKKKAEALRTGGKDTTVNVKTKAEADMLLNEAFPDYQKINGIGPEDAVGIRKKRKLDRYKQGGAYHKDYAVDSSTGRVRGHGSGDEHGEYPHINIKRTDGIKVIINIIGD